MTQSTLVRWNERTPQQEGLTLLTSSDGNDGGSRPPLVSTAQFDPDDESDKTVNILQRCINRTLEFLKWRRGTSLGCDFTNYHPCFIPADMVVLEQDFEESGDWVFYQSEDDQGQDHNSPAIHARLAQANTLLDASSSSKEVR